MTRGPVLPPCRDRGGVPNRRRRVPVSPRADRNDTVPFAGRGCPDAPSSPASLRSSARGRKRDGARGSSATERDGNPRRGSWGLLLPGAPKTALSWMSGSESQLVVIGICKGGPLTAVPYRAKGRSLDACRSWFAPSGTPRPFPCPESLVEAPGTAPGSTALIPQAVYRHSRQADTRNVVVSPPAVNPRAGPRLRHGRRTATARRGKAVHCRCTRRGRVGERPVFSGPRMLPGLEVPAWKPDDECRNPRGLRDANVPGNRPVPCRAAALRVIPGPRNRGRA